MDKFMTTQQWEVEVERHCRALLHLLGADPIHAEGVQETPKRMMRYFRELFEGMQYTNEDIAYMFDKCFEAPSDDLVIIKDISIFSHCEHHLALMYDMSVAIGYIPNKKVLGLSKAARIAEMCAKRLQLQERIGTDILEVLQIILQTEDIIIVIKGKHSCMSARGIKNTTAMTETATLSGRFKTVDSLRNEFYSLL